MPVSKLPKTGAMFWVDDSSTLTCGMAPEEIESHPWVVISDLEFHQRTGLVLAVPASSGGVRRPTDLRFPESEVLDVKQGKLKAQDRTILCAKVRHWRCQRVHQVGLASPGIVEAARRRVAVHGLGFRVSGS